MGAFFDKDTCHPERSEGPASDFVCHSVRSAAKRRAGEGPAARSRVRGLTFWLKATQALALAVAVCFSLGATDGTARVEKLGRQLMCTCGCAQLLGECDHAGCPNREEELNLLQVGVASNSTDMQIYVRFSAKYGAVVLAAPPASGFNLVAWIAPFAVFAAALLGTILLVRHWSAGRTEAAIDTADPEMTALRDRIRRETDDEGEY